MGVGGGHKKKKGKIAAEVGTTPSISFDAGKHTPLMQTQACLLSVTRAVCSDSL